MLTCCDARTLKEFLDQKDIHGCVPRAGYRYCKNTKNCIRFNDSCKTVPKIKPITRPLTILRNNIYEIEI